MMQIEHVILYRLYVEVKDAWTAEEWEAWENEKKEQREMEREDRVRAEMAIIDVGMGVVKMSAIELRPSE